MAKELKQDDKWEIESWARTLQEAEEIKADAEKMKKVAPILKKKLAGMKMTLEMIKQKAADMPMEEDEDSVEDKKEDKKEEK